MPTRRQCANAIRALAIDAIEKSRSGHPGAPLGMADMAEALWRHGFKHNPANPGWMDRDRFVLSNGHASMLLYAVLHLTGYDLSMDDIRNFRQLGSRTPGHPECDVTPGVEMTTGPLGQGISSAVGMALAEKMLATRFNTPEHTVIDHHTYVFLGDGCLMEGVSHEACSLAGVWGLGKLIALYDSNGISIDGKIDGWFTEDVAARYKAYGWQVIGPVDGHDAEALDAALAEARADAEHPSLIICKTHIGFGSSKADSASCHGSPLGVDVAAATCAALEWHQPAFSVPDDIAAAWDAREAGKKAEAEWQARFDAYRAACPELAAELERRMKGDLPADWADIAAAMVAEGKVASVQEAFDRYLGQQGAAYVAAERITPLAAVGLIAEFGGVPVLAHPKKYLLARTLGLLTSGLGPFGLAGIEVFYPGHTAADIAALTAEARRMGLIVTGGSDYHGDEEKNFVCSLPPDTLRALGVK